MKFFILLIFAFFFFHSFAQQGWTNLFDGKTLSGWQAIGWKC